MHTFLQLSLSEKQMQTHFYTHSGDMNAHMSRSLLKDAHMIGPSVKEKGETKSTCSMMGGRAGSEMGSILLQ